jgi:amino acid transporter
MMSDTFAETYVLICLAITEMSAYLPTRGSSMTMFADRFVSPSFGFALGWLYW